MEIVYENPGWTTLWIFIIALGISEIGKRKSE